MPESNSKPSKTTIPNLMDVTMEKIRDMVDVETIIGDPIPLERMSPSFLSLKFPMALPLVVLTCRQKFRKTCSAAERGLVSPFSPWAS